MFPFFNKLRPLSDQTAGGSKGGLPMDLFAVIPGGVILGLLAFWLSDDMSGALYRIVRLLLAAVAMGLVGMTFPVVVQMNLRRTMLMVVTILVQLMLMMAGGTVRPMP